MAAICHIVLTLTLHAITINPNLSLLLHRNYTACSCKFLATESRSKFTDGFGTNVFVIDQIQHVEHRVTTHVDNNGSMPEKHAANINYQHCWTSADLQ